MPSSRLCVFLTPLFLLLASGGPALSQDVVKRKVKKIPIVWAHYETKNYAIAYEKIIPLSTAKKVGRELEDVLEIYVKMFRAKPTAGTTVEPTEGRSKKAKGKSKEKFKFLVKFLDSPNTYEQEGGSKRHPAHYNGGSRSLVIKQMEFYNLLPTLYHEAFHQYIDMYMGYDAPIPIWFNEGMATYFEGMKRNEKTRAKKLDPQLVDNRKMRMVRNAVVTRTHIPLAELVDATHEEFHDPEKESLHYTQSFAVAYFLMQKSQRSVFNFMKELKKTKDLEAAYAKIFGKARKGLKKFEALWKQFVRGVTIEGTES